MMIQNLMTSISTFAATGPPDGCQKTFLGFKTWFAYFPSSWFGDPNGKTFGKCDINESLSKQLLPQAGQGQSGLLLIGLAIVDDLLRIAALVAVGFVIYGGIQYVTSQGSPDATTKARETIINALIGLAIAVVATGIVSFIGSRLS